MEIFLICIAALALAALFVWCLRKRSEKSEGLQSLDTHEKLDTSVVETPVSDSATSIDAPTTAKATEEEMHTEEQNIVGSKSHDEERGEEKVVTHNAQLVADLHTVFEEDKVFLRPDIHIEDVAKMLYTNRTYVTRLMRQEYGLSFIEYVNISRIQHSQGLLYSTDLTLDDIAEKSGFQSTSNYCRAFKRYIGTTPLAWKKSLKSEKDTQE